MSDSNKAIEALERIYSRAICLSTQEDNLNDNDHMIVSIALGKLDCAVKALEKLKNDYSFGNAQVYIDIENALKEING